MAIGKTSGNATELGFDTKLWAAADALRNHMDAAEYKRERHSPQPSAHGTNRGNLASFRGPRTPGIPPMTLPPRRPPIA